MYATLYRDDFVRDDIWDYICEAVGVAAPYDEVLEIEVTLYEATYEDKEEE